MAISSVCSLRANTAFAMTALACNVDDWPIHHTFGDGTDLGVIGMYRHGLDNFNDDRKLGGSHAFDESHTNRRKELGLTLKKEGVCEAVIDYEYQATTLDGRIAWTPRKADGDEMGFSMETPMMNFRIEFAGIFEQLLSDAAYG